MSAYIIQVSEPWNFQLSDGANVFRAQSVGSVQFPGRKKNPDDLLLNVDAPFEVDCELVKQIVCSPRYAGDTLATMRGVYCTVGISRVKPEVTLSAGSVIKADQVVYFAIGSIAAA